MESDQIKERLDLRNTYVGIIRVLDSQPQAAYSRDELIHMKILLESFDFDDPIFLNSHACLFEPLSLQTLEKFAIIESGLEGPGAQGYYFDFDDQIYEDPTGPAKNPPATYVMAERADQIFSHLKSSL
ncbi:hypothetical protein ASPZODRAFT_168270 [Penicilliopsis zonata CBS 506.65]|uniref:Uncharacterized protein n=1 Tax=Penicilliopsis zonata CBS 506.65 TaxID=1073090 RepID=A0A1L9SBP6_9EURO|nr:hypothetical protein ASPZODRAFT_168270 [Penicilliopsis zonata CBS 506.65]OJJ44548.1 hypothetical protein ASPZODRAFT_168270 [Penicilliopsis zonata CBS 506.65]